MKRPGLRLEKKRTIVQSLRKMALRIGAGTIIVYIALAAAPFQSFAAAPQPPKTFSSPDDAAHAMVDALRKGDRPALLTILGDGSQGLITSGDPVADKNSAQTFLKAYDQMHRFSHWSNGELFLVVGAENWPLPIPLKKNSSGWYFDTAAGQKELIYRRIGQNERSALRTLDAIVAGQHQYYGQSHNQEATGQYAARFMSTSGKQDGLYWGTATGAPESPIGPLVARASAEGYRAGSAGKPTPVHGYYFKILTRQGKDAPGGAKDYMVDGKLTGGFAVLAYPASYRSSGVMTFMVNADGDVLQKDLGPKTAKLASSLDTYNPDQTWQPVQ
jgi:hypothetical protein